MAAPKKQPPIQSPLVGAFNNIVNINRSRTAMRSTQSSFDDFLRFMSVEVKNIEAIKLPDDKKVKKLANINVANTFGRPGSLLSSLFSGALDLGSFLGSTFGGRKPSSPKAGGAIPKGKGIRLGGFKALGVANAAFAGLDFATGLAEGESVSKAAAGAGGALAGSMLGGAIGQALIPVPGVGFMIGSALGGMAGGWLGDRAHETVTGEGKVKDKQEQKLKEAEVKQKTAAAAAVTTTLTFPQVLDKFDSVVTNFERTIAGGFLGSSSVSSDDFSQPGGAQDTGHEEIDPRKGGGASPENTQDNDYTATGGSLPSKYINTKDYNEFRQYYNGGKGGRHQGEDLPITQGTKVSIIVPGKVAQAGFSGGGAGGNILITHEDGRQTRYLHMSEIYVKPGDTIESGKVIGATGGTPGTKGAGRSSGPHLHFEYYGSTGGGPMDPIPQMDRYFRFGGNVKVKPKPGSGTVTSGAGKPTAVLMAGTNDYGSPQSGAAGVKQAIKNLQDKGYNVVVVPPSEVGGTAKVSQAVQQAAKEMGATIQKGQYKPKDNSGAIGYAHLTDKSAEDIKNKYKGATFVGDSNAQMIPGATIAMPGKSASDIANKIKTDLPSAGPAVRPKENPQVTATTQQPVQPQQLQQYPTYNQPSSTVTIIPMMMGAPGGGSQQRPMVVSSNGGGGGTTIMPSISQGQVLNSLMKTVLLTNLSGT